MQIPGLAGTRFRDVEVCWGGKSLSIYAASPVEIGTPFLPHNPSPPAGTMKDYVWAVGWPAAFALAEWMAEQDFRGLSVLELGCGVGVCSLAAAVAGADVTATDMKPEALFMARQNAARNGLVVETFAADWKTWPIRAQFGCIIGSDIVYEEAAVEPLLLIFNRSLALDGHIFLADPGRLAICKLRDRAFAAGWSWYSFELSQNPVLPGETVKTIWLHILKKPER